MQMNELQENWLEGKIDKKLYWTLMRENFTSVLPQIQLILKKSDECHEIKITKDGCILVKSNGLQLFFDFKQSICRAETDLLMKEDYEKKEMDYISNYLKEKKCQNVLDIGANVGLFSLELYLENSDITYHLFEPIPTTFDMMKKTAKLNNVNNNLFIMNNMGMSNEKGKFDFYLPGACEAASLQPIDDTFYLKESDAMGNYSGKSVIKKVECKVNTIDNYIESNNIEDIGFIKIDVEGNEKSVLFGAEKTLSKYHPMVYCELLRKHASRFGYHPNEVIDYMKKFDYNCYTLRNNELIQINKIDDKTMETNFFFMMGHPQK